ncbi:MAG TPA: CGNR zinc finger domain-containing protein [Gaiellaceae bacterium]|nr:CGNR zinc finger domain-containing protein [Gaiellaceae bacterium]
MTELTDVAAFVNTLEIEDGTDEIASWLEARGVRPTPASVGRAAAVREAIRAHLLAHNGIPVELSPAAAVLEEAARRSRLGLRFGTVPPRLEPEADGVDGVLGSLLAAIAAAAADGTWDRLKACRAETCRWAFYDDARNRSRAWCSMKVCGNRAKARAYRARRGSA